MSLLLFQVHSTACVTLSLCPPHSFVITLLGMFHIFFLEPFNVRCIKLTILTVGEIFSPKLSQYFLVFSRLEAPKKRDSVPCLTGDVKLWR